MIEGNVIYPHRTHCKTADIVKSLFLKGVKRLLLYMIKFFSKGVSSLHLCAIKFFPECEIRLHIRMIYFSKLPIRRGLCAVGYSWEFFECHSRCYIRLLQSLLNLTKADRFVCYKRLVNFSNGHKTWLFEC